MFYSFKTFGIESEGNFTIQVGLVQLLALVKCLERNYTDLMAGISVEYGGLSKNYKSVSQAFGWSKIRKNRHEPSDGRPHNTTTSLLSSKKLGRSKGATGFDCNPVTTYQSYVATQKSPQANRCWMNSLLECLYALINPLWFRGSNGKSADLYTKLTQHLSLRATCEMSEVASMAKILVQGQNNLQNALQSIFEGMFKSNEFHSADTFFKKLFNSKINTTAPIKTLWRVDCEVKYICSKDSSHQKKSLKHTPSTSYHHNSSMPILITLKLEA